MKVEAGTACYAAPLHSEAPPRAWSPIHVERAPTGTVGSSSPNARMPHYYAAKGALANLTIGLAKEVAGSNVRVNLVSPGLLLTPEVEQQFLERGRRKGWGDTWAGVEPHVAADIPIRRIARREEVADLVVYLASPLADAIHGQNIRIDGGGLGIVS